MASSTFSSMLFLLVLVLSLHMDEALGAQTKIRKLMNGGDSEGEKVRRKSRPSRLRIPVKISSWRPRSLGMGSSSDKRRYPPRLYPVRKAPSQSRSMHHNCQLASFGLLKESIGEKIYEEIRDKSAVGVILKLADSSYVWNSKVVHHFLTQQLAIARPHEVWCLIEGYPLRFSLHEFSDITGLNCDTIDEAEKLDLNHRDFWAEMEVDYHVGPTWKELDIALKNARTWLAPKKKMLGLLYVLHVGILGLARDSRLPLQYAVRVLDSEAFERYPWGRVGFKSLVESIKVLSLQSQSYVLHGCVHAMVIWAFDSVPVLGRKCGNKKVVVDEDPDENGEEIVPLLMWNAGRPRFDIADFLAGTKKSKGKLFVHHMVVKPLAEIYPIWPGENCVFGEQEGAFKLVDNLIHDIVNGGLDEKAWDDDVVKKNSKRQIIEESADEDDFVDLPARKSKMETMSSKSKGESGKKMKPSRPEREGEPQVSRPNRDRGEDSESTASMY